MDFRPLRALLRAQPAAVSFLLSSSAGPQSVFRNNTCELQKKSKGEPELTHERVYYVSENYLDFTKEGNCICLSTYTHQFNEFRTKKKHMETHISPPQPLPHSSGVFVCFIDQDFFLVFFFSLPYYQVKGNGCYLRFQKLGFRDLSLVIYSLGQVI